MRRSPDVRGTRRRSYQTIVEPRVILKWHKRDDDVNTARERSDWKKRENGEIDPRRWEGGGGGREGRESVWGWGWVVVGLGLGEGARLHFRLRSAELKGGPCTNETQFHATLSLPVLFPGFHFH